MAYARTSTEEQALSLGAQSAKFEEYARVHGVRIVDVVSDQLSGKTASNRPGLQRALAMLDAGEADGLLVAKLDRLTRSVADGEDLVEKYFTKRFVLLSVSDAIDTRSAGGRMVFRILMAFAQFEREVIAERTKDSLTHLRAQGGGVPRLEGPAVARILELDAAGLSLRAIASRLEAEGRRTMKGGRWASETVRKVLQRARAA